MLADRTLWLQSKGWSGKTGMWARAFFGQNGSWIDVTPTISIGSDLLNPSDERAWQRDINSFRKRTSAKIRERHRLRETVVVRIPAQAGDGYFQLVLCLGQKKKVLCTSPTFRLMSLSTNPSSIKGASLSTLPLEIGALALSTYAMKTAGAVTAPARALAHNQVQKYVPSWAVQKAVSLEVHNSGLQDRVKSTLSDGNSLYEQHRAGSFMVVGGAEVSFEDGPTAPYPIHFTSRSGPGMGKEAEMSNFPVVTLGRVPNHISLQLYGYYFGWCRFKSDDKETSVSDEDGLEQVVLSALLPDASQLHRANFVEANTKRFMLRIATELDETIFIDKACEIWILGFLRPDQPAQRANIAKGIEAGDAAAEEASTLAEINDISMIQAILDQPSWSFETVLEKRRLENSGGVKAGYANARLAAQRHVVSLNLTVAPSGGNASSPLLYGLLYEDVYHSGDGGLYSELIQNRAFQGSIQNAQSSTERSLQFWHTFGLDTLTLDNSPVLLSEALPYHMRVDVAQGATGPTGFWNEGFAGMNITTKTRYAANFYLRGDYTGQIDCAFYSNTTGKTLGTTTFQVAQSETNGWVKYSQTFTITDSAPDEKNTFSLIFDGASVAGKSLRFNLISVFQQTYKNSNNGLRMDLAEGVNAIGGKFLRLPGGNNMEGVGSPWRWKWNETIGPIENRPGRPGTWGYPNTDGLGLLEMLQWTIDMDLEILLAVWGGLFLNGDIITEEDLQPYVDDVLNELEFLMGPNTTQYGALRASLGYPDPFKIKYFEISNEDFLNGGKPSYIAYRFNAFNDAIKKAYPDAITVSSIDTNELNPPNPPNTITDLHLYQNVDQTIALFNAYDNRPRSQPLLVGEYATIADSTTPQGQQLDNPTLESATSEAIMFLGLERNSDLVMGSCHGALIKSLHDEPDNVAMMKHTPNAIVYSMSYYVAKLFASNYGSSTVLTSSDSGYGPLYWSTTKDDKEVYYVKIVNFAGQASTLVTHEWVGE
ncbi:hypothetical protein G7Y89_g13678 [Cudoniella acicularis]|uniref:non-reducing end alpha-L-arabinofuranosidase n=1 Tax=Cudoniella acicularis TaxID=354080 RepID=A0A8H4R700_9HELO|nr:hypothetical protein G7Y89_g13678 [Cudoniella acicularis]